MSIKVYVPREATARSLGADAVAGSIAAEAARRGEAVELIRSGSRGLFWLEPLVEVASDSNPLGNRIGYGPVQVRDVPELFASGFLQGGTHRLSQGAMGSIEYLKRQERLTCGRLGLIDPVNLDEFLAPSLNLLGENRLEPRI